MAKKNPRDTDRRAIAEKLRQDQQRQERRRSMLILGVCVVVVIGLLAAAVIPFLRDRAEQREAAGTPLGEIGASAADASCDDVGEQAASGNNEHLTIGEPIDYDAAPPSSGPHWANFLQGSEIRSLYTADDRPEVERLVHSLEHGHTVLWYDDTVSPDSDAYADVSAIAGKFDGETDKFIAAPWTSDDGDPFPEGKHVALTHWTGGGDSGDQLGITQYCGAPSGAVVEQFMDDYPASDAPEPNAP